jgi:hypothetical protein
MSFLRQLLFPRGPARATRPSATDHRATDDDVYFAYRLILKRNPDAAGLAHHLKLVAGGLSLDRLIRSFVNSDEYRFRQADEAVPTPVDLGGYQVCIQKLDTDFGQTILHTHQYEEHVRQAARENLHPGDVAVDVGANIGVLTYRGIVLNGLENVEVFPYAASNRRSVFSLTGGTSNTHLVGARAPQEGGHFVQSIVLDEALGELPRLDFVKMDIEGHEPQALEGFSRLIERHRPVLLVEFNPRCLVTLQQQSPLAFLKQIFGFYPRVQVTSAFDDNQVFESAERVMDYWERRNREITAEKRLPDGMLHFDLVTLK